MAQNLYIRKENYWLDVDYWTNKEKVKGEFFYVILWREPMPTAIIFGATLLVLIMCDCLSMASWFCMLAIGLLSLSGLGRILIGCLHMTNVYEAKYDPYRKYLDSELGIPTDASIRFAAIVFYYINESLHALRSLILIENTIASIKLFIGLLSLSVLLDYFDIITILMGLWIAMFTLPKLYESQEDNIAMLVDKIRRCFYHESSTTSSSSSAQLGLSASLPPSATSSSSTFNNSILKRKHY